MADLDLQDILANPRAYMRGKRYRDVLENPDALRMLAEAMPREVLNSISGWINKPYADAVWRAIADKEPSLILRYGAEIPPSISEEIAKKVGRSVSFEELFMGKVENWGTRFNRQVREEAMKPENLVEMAKKDPLSVARFKKELENIYPSVDWGHINATAVTEETLAKQLKDAPALVDRYERTIAQLPGGQKIIEDSFAQESLQRAAEKDYRSVFDIAKRFSGQPWALDVLKSGKGADYILSHIDWVTQQPFGKELLQHAVNNAPSEALRKVTRLMRLPYGEELLRTAIEKSPNEAFYAGREIGRLPFYKEALKTAAQQDPLSFHASEDRWRQLPWAQEIRGIINDKEIVTQAITKDPTKFFNFLDYSRRGEIQNLPLSQDEIKAALAKSELKVGADDYSRSDTSILRNFGYLQDNPQAEKALRQLAELMPEQFLENAQQYAHLPYAAELLQKAAEDNPLAAIRAVQANNFSGSEVVLAAALKPENILALSDRHDNTILRYADLISKQPYGEQLLRDTVAKGESGDVLRHAETLAKIQPYGTELLKAAAAKAPMSFLNEAASNETRYQESLKDPRYGKVTSWKGQPWFQETMQSALSGISKMNVDDAYGLFRHFKTISNLPETENLVRQAAERRPSDALGNAQAFIDKPYAKEVLMAAAAKAPIDFLRIEKDFPNVPWKKDVAAAALSREGLIQASIGYGGDFVLKNLPRFAMQPWAKDVVAAAIRSDESGVSFYQNYKGIKAAMPKDVAGLETVANLQLLRSLQRDPQYASQRLGRVINELHEEAGDIRFKSLEKLSASDMFGLVVHGRSEIYTSTFMGIVDRIIPALKAEGKTFLDLTTDPLIRNQLPTFFEAAASYGKIDSIFASLPDEQARKGLLNTIFSSVSEAIDGRVAAGSKPPADEEKNTALSAAIALADTMFALKSKDMRGSFEEALIQHYNDAKSPGLKTAFGLVASAYLNETKTPTRPELFAAENFKEKFPIPSLSGLPNDKLFTNGKHIQQMFFYKDEDGAASYNSFMAQYQGRAGWKIEDKGSFVVVNSTQNQGRQVTVVANKPMAGGEGLETASTYLKDTPPHFIVHRGHSYHTSQTMGSIKDSTSAVFWGSCGGYQNISETLARSPGAHILSTKGVGTMQVNDPLFRMVNEEILKSGNIQWSDIWAKASKQVGDKRFEQYVSPEKNFGALFIQAYDKAIKEQMAQPGLGKRTDVDIKLEGQPEQPVIKQAAIDGIPSVNSAVPLAAEKGIIVTRPSSLAMREITPSRTTLAEYRERAEQRDRAGQQGDVAAVPKSTAPDQEPVKVAATTKAPTDKADVAANDAEQAKKKPPTVKAAAPTATA